MESCVPSAEISLLFNGIPLVDIKKSLKEYGVKDGDMVMMDPGLTGPSRAAPAAEEENTEQVRCCGLKIVRA